MMKGYKTQIYPTSEQEQSLWKHIGARRFIWNHIIDIQNERYENGEKHLSQFEMIKLLTQLKKEPEFSWLNDVSNTSLQRTCTDLDKAYQRFFKKEACCPKYKSRKRSKPSYPVCCEKFYFKDDKYIVIQKIGKVRYKTDFRLPIGRNKCKFCNVRVFYDEVKDKWFVSFSMEYENQTPELTDKDMGIDLGVKDLAAVAYGDEKIVYHNINKSQKMRNIDKKLKHTQRTISRKYEKNRVGRKYIKTNNIMREEKKLRKLYRRQQNIRNNYIHQTTHQLVSMLSKRIVMEDLNISGMMKNKHLSKAIQEQCLYEFTRQMQYKCEWNGIEFIQADRFYPSSKTCSCCGNIKHNLKLSDRTYFCERCGSVIDRDFNAALNLSRYVA